MLSPQPDTEAQTNVSNRHKAMRRALTAEELSLRQHQSIYSASRSTSETTREGLASERENGWVPAALPDPQIPLLNRTVLRPPWIGR